MSNVSLTTAVKGRRGDPSYPSAFLFHSMDPGGKYQNIKEQVILIQLDAKS